MTVSRDEFEKRKNYVESILRKLGCKEIKISVPHSVTTMVSNEVLETWNSCRSSFHTKTGFYRVDEILFPNKPFIVLEWGETWEEVQNNCMEDLNPFPYDLPDEEIEFELRRTIE